MSTSPGIRSLVLYRRYIRIILEASREIVQLVELFSYLFENWKSHIQSTIVSKHTCYNGTIFRLTSWVQNSIETERIHMNHISILPLSPYFIIQLMS